MTGTTASGRKEDLAIDDVDLIAQVIKNWRARSEAEQTASDQRRLTAQLGRANMLLAIRRAASQSADDVALANAAIANSLSLLTKPQTKDPFGNVQSGYYYYNNSYARFRLPPACVTTTKRRNVEAASRRTIILDGLLCQPGLR